MEIVVRWTLIALATTAFGLAGPAIADGTVLRWNDIVGLQGENNLELADLAPAANSIWIDSGFATLDLETGSVTIVVRHVSWNWNNPGAAHPLGAALDGAPFGRSGKFVCDPFARYGGPALVETEAFFLDASGSARYQGRVDVPTVCKDYPDQVLFVIGASAKSIYWANDAGRVVLGSQ
jgi:hypothetical protein